LSRLASSPQRAERGHLASIPSRYWPEIIAALLAAIGIFLLFHDLDANGFTWDERADFLAARDVAAALNPFANLEEPDQARFSHLLGAVTLRLWEPSSRAFKLTFALVGLAGGALLFTFLRRRFGTRPAALVTAFYFCNPYLLAASRAGATAGDVTVAVLWLLALWGLVVWLEHPGHSRPALLTGLAVGLAIGAKLTSVVLLPLVALHLLFLRRPWSRSALTLILRPAAIFFVAAAVFAVVGDPLLLLGPDLLREAIDRGAEFDARPHRYFGEWLERPPVSYVPAVLVAKLGILFCTFLGVAAIWWVRRTLTRRALDPILVVCLAHLGLIFPFAVKPFQNAHYYVVFIPAMLVLVAGLLHAIDQHPREVVRTLGLVAFLVTIALSAATSAWLAPDFLQAGREYGDQFQGEFEGPAVNHCQGGPALFSALNARTGASTLEHVHLFHDDCIGVLELERQAGPVEHHGEVRAYDESRPPGRPHVLAISRTFVFFSRTSDDAARKPDRIARATAGCEVHVLRHEVYRVYICP
jgi:4-amino-4-deoxy-L-arabinose transferase-like glycosyltransferase